MGSALWLVSGCEGVYKAVNSVTSVTDTKGAQSNICEGNELMAQNGFKILKFPI